MQTIKLTENLQFNQSTQEFIFNGKSYPVKKIERALSRWNKFTENAKNGIGGIKHKSNREKKREKNKLKLKKLFHEFKDLKEAYTKSSIGQELRKAYNQKHQDKYTIYKFYNFVKKHIDIEMKSRSGVPMKILSSVKDLNTISIMAISKGQK